MGTEGHGAALTQVIVRPIDCLARARSFLFVPGDRPERFGKAARSGADAVVLDLEDAVAETAKSLARDAISASWPSLRASGVPVVVRIGGGSDGALAADLATVASLDGLSAVMVPKVECAKALARVRVETRGAPLVPLVESARGYDRLHAIASVPGVIRLALGHLDFMADAGISCDNDQAELLPLRFAIAMQTRVHGLASAIDGVTTSVDDVERLAADVRRARRLGFGGKLCIHPGQVAVVHAGFAPTETELVWARRVVDADRTGGGGVVRVDGQMVDRPVVLRAQQLLANHMRCEEC